MSSVFNKTLNLDQIPSLFFRFWGGIIVRIQYLYSCSCFVLRLPNNFYAMHTRMDFKLFMHSCYSCLFEIFANSSIESIEFIQIYKLNNSYILNTTICTRHLEFHILPRKEKLQATLVQVFSNVAEFRNFLFACTYRILL